MKKLCLVAGIFSFSVVGFAQQKTPTSVKMNDTLVQESTNTQQRIQQLEKEITDLKATQVEVRKQLSEVQPAATKAPKKKKLFVSRAGSKQLVWAEKEQLFY